MEWSATVEGTDPAVMPLIGSELSLELPSGASATVLISTLSPGDEGWLAHANGSGPPPHGVIDAVEE